MTKAEQSAFTLKLRRKHTKIARRLLKAYYDAINVLFTDAVERGISYRVTDSTELSDTLTTIYYNISSDIEGVDLTTIELKVIETDKQDVRARLDRAINERLAEILDDMAATINKQLNTSEKMALSQALELEITDGRQKALLANRIYRNYYTNHLIIQTTTEVAWGVERGKVDHIVAVDDVLGKTIDKLIELIQNNKFNEARKLSREALKLGFTSTNQIRLSDAITGVATRLRVVTPLNQAQAVASLRKDKEEFKTDQKTWINSGGNIRESHLKANGQTVFIDEPYALDAGSLLQYPSDGSLGAPLKEIINCKCFSFYT